MVSRVATSAVALNAVDLVILVTMREICEALGKSVRVTLGRVSVGVRLMASDIGVSFFC